jgi:hypothetical protein
MQSALNCKRFELFVSLRKREMVDFKAWLVISVLAQPFNCAIKQKPAYAIPGTPQHGTAPQTKTTNHIIPTVVRRGIKSA